MSCYRRHLGEVLAVRRLTPGPLTVSTATAPL